MERGLAPAAGFAESAEAATKTPAPAGNALALIAAARQQGQAILDFSRQSGPSLCAENILSLLAGWRSSRAASRGVEPAKGEVRGVVVVADRRIVTSRRRAATDSGVGVGKSGNNASVAIRTPACPGDLAARLQVLDQLDSIFAGLRHRWKRRDLWNDCLAPICTGAYVCRNHRRAEVDGQVDGARQVDRPAVERRLNERQVGDEGLDEQAVVLRQSADFAPAVSREERRVLIRAPSGGEIEAVVARGGDARDHLARLQRQAVDVAVGVETQVDLKVQISQRGLQIVVCPAVTGAGMFDPWQGEVGGMLLAVCERALELEYPAEPRVIAEIRDRVEAFVRPHGITHDLENVKMAVSEHAGTPSATARRAGAGTASGCSARSRTTAYGWKSSTTAPASSRKRSAFPTTRSGNPSGRGLFLMVALMDEVQFEGTPCGTHVRLAKSAECGEWSD